MTVKESALLQTSKGKNNTIDGLFSWYIYIFIGVPISIKASAFSKNLNKSTSFFFFDGVFFWDDRILNYKFSNCNKINKILIKNLIFWLIFVNTYSHKMLTFNTLLVMGILYTCPCFILTHSLNIIVIYLWIMI